MNRLPQFTLADYRKLLRALIDARFSFEPVVRLGERAPNSVYLRHDIDFSVELAIDIAIVEHDLGISATYYVLLTGPYNIFDGSSSQAIQKLPELGHNIGLHYDLSFYPQEPVAAETHLEKELDILEYVAETKIKTSVMHLPFQNNQDLFLQYKDLVNPSFFCVNDPDLLYISDSCRAWRDDNLIRFLERQTDERRLHLNIHPELWLAKTQMDRNDYLDNVLIPAVFRKNRQFFSETVRDVWLSHPGVTQTAMNIK